MPEDASDNMNTNSLIAATEMQRTKQSLRVIMTMKAIAVLFILAAGLSGCAGIDTAQLAAPDTSWHVVLTENMTYKGKRGLYSYEEGLKKGEYRPEYQDESGIYLRGPEQCAFTTPGHDGIMRVYEGGIWLPKDFDMSKARIYSYFSAEYFYEQNPAAKDPKYNVLTAPIRTDDGKIIFFSSVEDPTFLVKIKNKIVN